MHTNAGAVLPSSMKVLQILSPEHADVVVLPVPEPGPGQVLVQVKAVTTCPQWDLHIYYGRPMFASESHVPFPYVPGQPGHEMTGTVAALGADVSDLTLGQRVAAWRDQGHHRPGCYAEYVVMDAASLLPIPDSLQHREVASLELAMCVAASVMRLRDTFGIAGKRCAVNGLGPAGLIAVQLLLAEGAAAVIGFDPNADRRTLALELGAVSVYDPQQTNVPLRHEADAVQISVDCVGYPDALRFIMDRTQEAIALFAVQRHDYILHHPGLSVLGYPGHFVEAARYSLDLIERGQLQLTSLISAELPFERYAEAVELLKSQQALKICFVPDLAK